MGRSVISGAEDCFFKNLHLSAILVEWSDTRKPRLAVHEFLKRDGAQIEYMGRAPHVVKMNLVFMGAQWRDKFLLLASEVDKDPFGTLSHPALGSMEVCCQGFENATMNAEAGADMYIVPTSFIENNVDIKLQSKVISFDNSQAFENHSSTLLNLIAKLSAGYVAISNFVLKAINAIATLKDLNDAGRIGFFVPQELLAVKQYADVARAAVEEDVRDEFNKRMEDAKKFDLYALIALLEDDINQEMAKLSAKRKNYIKYTVPTQVSVGALSASFYGADAKNRIEEILANNPGKIPNPAAISPGTVLNMAIATVVNTPIFGNTEKIKTT